MSDNLQIDTAPVHVTDETFQAEELEALLDAVHSLVKSCKSESVRLCIHREFLEVGR